MKKGLIALALLLTLGMSVPTLAQKHRHTPRGTELVDTTRNSSAIEAFSDTTSVDSSTTRTITYDWDSDDEDVNEAIDKIGKLAESINSSGLAWLMWVIAIIVAVLVFLLLLSPFIIVLLLIYFVNRNRKQKVQMAQMAMQNGQPIPNDLLNEKQDDWDRNDYQAGIRQMFTGVGLAIFLGITAGKYGFSIGALVFFIGLGKWFVARQAGTTGNRPLNDNHSSNFNNNNSNIQNYD